MSIYPKVIVLGQAFNKKSGGGITLTNLFTGWPRDRLASVSFIQNEDWSVCGIQYLMGFEESKKPWPFRLLQNKSKSRILKFAENGSNPLYNEIQSSGCQKTRSSFLTNPLHKIGKSVSRLVGLHYLVDRIKLSAPLIKFIHEFNPDIIYTQLASKNMIVLTDEIRDRFRVPITIHIMDDWPVSIDKYGFLGTFLNKLTHSRFRNLLQKAQLLIAISNIMKEEYIKRYGLSWLTFHNPVEVEGWGKNYSKTNSHAILYFGRIGRANQKSLLFCAKAIDKLRDTFKDIELNIYSPDYRDTGFNSAIKKLKGTKLFSPIPHDMVPYIMSSADVLLLPLDFDKSAKDFTHYSLPTKATEYMASGVPVLVFAPSQNAVYEYAREHNWAYLVDKMDIDLLTKAIIDLINNSELRHVLVKNAKDTVKKNHNASIVREKFREALYGATVVTEMML